MKRNVTICLLLVLLAVTLSGCQKKAVSVEAERLAKLDTCFASAKEKSDLIKSSLENDALTQIDMNMKAQELNELWESTLNNILDEAKNILPKDEWEKLTTEQNTWLEEKEKAANAAGNEFEGGSLYTLTVNMESARIIEERVCELYEMLK